MGKKKKKNRDNSLTFENQMRISDQLFEMVSKSEKASVTIFDGIEKKKKKSGVDDLTKQIDRSMKRIAQNNLDNELEEALDLQRREPVDEGELRPYTDSEGVLDDDILGFDLDFNKDTSGVSFIETKELEDISTDECDEYESDEVSIINYPHFNRSIEVKMIDNLGKLIIDDGLFPTTISLPHVKETKMDEEFVNMVVNSTESDDEYSFSEYVANLLYFIIATKHPTAIFTIDEFTNVFRDVIEIDTQELIFFANDKYVFFYRITGENRTKLYDLLDIMDSVEFIRTLYTIGLNSGTVHQAFLADDVDYIENFRNSDYNDIEFWSNYILIRKDTIRSTDGNNDVLNNMNVIDLDGYRSIVSVILDELFYIDDVEDEEEVDPIKTITPLVNTEAFDIPEPVLVQYEIDDLVDGLESIDVDNISESSSDDVDVDTEPSDNDTDSMVVPVIRKK